MAKPYFVIVNPTSGNGKSKRNWSKIQQLLIENNIEFIAEVTQFPSHSKALARKAILSGYRHIICVGGDGTVHNVINGIMSQTTCPSNTIHLGVIPIGTGNDWARSYDIPKNLSAAVKIIAKDRVNHQDIGKIELLNPKGSIVYFNNLVGVGFDGLVVSKVQKYKYLGGIAYFLGTLQSLVKAKNFRCAITTNSLQLSTRTLMVLTGLCRYSGGGMQLTNSPDPKDALFDISIAENLTSIDIIRNLSRLYNGTISKSKKVITSKSDFIKITILEKPLPYIEADGELIGSGGMQISIVPRALTFYSP